MPLFGKGRKRKNNDRFLEKNVSRGREHGKRAYSKREQWFIENTGLKGLRKAFRLLFYPDDFIEKKFLGENRPVRVLDWGCGKGRAISELAKDYGEKVEAFGYSADSYREWQHIKNVVLIHATKEDLFRYLKRIGQVDLVYSSLGLRYLFFPYKPTHPQTIQRGVGYISKLLRFVPKEGKIVFDLHFNKPEKEFDSAISMLKLAFGKTTDIECDGRFIYITKK